MTVEELRKYFFDKLNNCYPVLYNNYSNIVLWFYSESHIRNIKLNMIDGNENVSLPNKVIGRCLFHQDIDQRSLWVDEEDVWFLFNKYYSDNYLDVQLLIETWLEESVNFHSYHVFKQTNISKRSLEMELETNMDLFSVSLVGYALR